MLTKKEITVILLSSLIIGVCLSLKSNLSTILASIGIIFLVIIVNIFSKKIASFYLDTEIEHELWTLKYPGLLSLVNPFSFLGGMHPSHKFKNPIQIGLFLPILTTIFSLGNLVWLASTSFEVKPKSYRAAKRFGLYSFSEVTEHHIGLIAFWGIVGNLFIAFIAYLLNFPELARISIYFSFFNILPLSELDGNKLFYGNMILWSVTAIVVLIALAYALLLV